MARIELETYYKALFKEQNYANEEIKEINRAHAISSSFYDIQFTRNSLIYRDKNSTLVVPIEHNFSHEIILHLTYFSQNNKCNMPLNILQKRIENALDFLKVKFEVE
jgi:hypothetical protein